MTYVTLEINNYAPTPMIRSKNEMLHDLQDRQEAYHIGRKESTADTSSLNETSKQAQRQQQIYLQREMVIQSSFLRLMVIQNLTQGRKHPASSWQVKINVCLNASGKAAKKPHPSARFRVHRICHQLHGLSLTRQIRLDMPAHVTH
jgi:hypothetical protein